MNAASVSDGWRLIPDVLTTPAWIDQTDERFPNTHREDELLLFIPLCIHTLEFLYILSCVYIFGGIVLDLNALDVFQK